MKTIVLDTNIIVSEPMILAKRTTGVELIIPSPVLMELALISFKRDDISIINQLVREAISNGNVIIYKLQRPADMSLPLPSDNDYSIPNHISGSDYDIITAARELTGNGKDVYLATRDAHLRQAATALGVGTIELEELRQLFLQPTIINASMETRARRIHSTQTRQLLIGILAGASSSMVINLLWSHINEITSSIPVWGTILGILILGFGLYAIRGRFRLSYGVLECCFGFIAAMRVFWPDFDYSKVATTDVFQMIAGIYIIVRGQDNIGKAIQKTRFAPGWRLVFGDQ